MRNFERLVFCFLLLTPACAAGGGAEEASNSAGNAGESDLEKPGPGGTADGAGGSATGGTASAAGTAPGGGASSDDGASGECEEPKFHLLYGGYVCAEDVHGYAWTAATEDATIEPKSFSDLRSHDTQLCVKGSTAASYSSYALIGINANQPASASTPLGWTPAANLEGLNVTVKKSGTFALRLQLVTAEGNFCATIEDGANAIGWPELTKECWVPGGTPYNGSTPIKSVQLFVPGDMNGVVNFDFCVQDLSTSDDVPVKAEDPVDPVVVDPVVVDPVVDPPVLIDESNCSEADKTICENKIGMHCGYTFEFWRDSGGGCMLAKPGGGFSLEWGDQNNVLARKGVRPGTGAEVVNYKADYSADGASFMGIYGWTRGPLIEYYIVDNWGGGLPGSSGESFGSVESDGATYDVFRTQQKNKPSIDGNTTFYQYWSVRKTKRSTGTITVGNHFEAWKKAGLELGTLYEVSFVVEGYRSKGAGNVQMSMSTR